MSRTMWLLAAAVVAALLAGPVAAAPSLDIQKPPVVPVPSNTGPTQDPHAEQGQWFQDEHSGDKVVCTHEFYDNVQQPAEKGGWAGHYAIVGHVLNIRYDGITQNIIAFDINATITNDVPDYEGWRPGDNSHGESLQTSDQYVGDLLQTKLTADFAVPPSSAGLLPGTIGPYRDASPHIIALNHDFLAWYCWTPDNGDPDKQPNGSYYVPAWDFLDIPQGQSYVRVLMFTVEAPGLSPDDPRYAAIEESYYDEQDILLNRTSSLKISTWQDDPTIDYGIPYPHLDGAMPLRSSDCSVFHNIVHEPEWIEGGLSLDVRKPPVAPLGSWTGPPQDFDAVQGQWFLRFDGTEEVRSHEYYDPTWPASLPAKSAAKKTDKKSAKSTLKAPAKAAAKGVGSAIYGVVTNVRYVAGSTNIAAFDIDATITNLTPWPYSWEDGSNSHDEFLSTDEQYEGTLCQTKLTAEFAIDTLFGTGGLPPAGYYPPYRDTDPHICATNHDQLAWYCWTPDNLLDRIPFGKYYVPTWDFGDISQGASASRTLSFTVDGNGLPPTDLRYNVILDSQQNGTDVLANRTTSLKISTWIDDIYKDDGTMYPHLVDPGLPLRSSDCSVFHNIEEEPPDVGGLSLPVTQPPVVNLYPWTGPQRDPVAKMGQWFRDLETHVEDYRTNEFYDPSYEWLQGVFIGSHAIHGQVVNVQYDALMNIVAFDIDATITNLTPWPFDWCDGSNSHSETLSTDGQYGGPLFDTKLTAEFAVPRGVPIPPNAGAYRNVYPEVIEAVNHDQLGWYCWTPDNPGDGLVPWGDYTVPTWDFGDIPQGASASRLLEFVVVGAIMPGDPRYAVIRDSEQNGTDVLANRTTSLKISTWIDDLAADTGVPYPHETEELPLRSSDCSVFHNTEPRIGIDATLDWDWVYTNRPISLGWVLKSVLTIAIVNDPLGNTTYTATVAPSASSTGQVHIVQPTADPLVWNIYGGSHNGGAQGMVFLEVQVNGVEVGGIGLDLTPLKVRVLGDIDDNGGTEPSDLSKLIMKLNGMPVPGYPDPRSYDYDGNGGAEPTDMSTMINVLNGIPMP